MGISQLCRLDCSFCYSFFSWFRSLRLAARKVTQPTLPMTLTANPIVPRPHSSALPLLPAYALGSQSQPPWQGASCWRLRLAVGFLAATLPHCHTATRFLSLLSSRCCLFYPFSYPTHHPPAPVHAATLCWHKSQQQRQATCKCKPNLARLRQ